MFQQNLKEPKLKKQKNVQLFNYGSSPPNQILETLDRHYLKLYNGYLIDNKVFIKANEAVDVYKLGHFGRGEYSRGEPSLNSIFNQLKESDNVFDYKNIQPITIEKYNNKIEWSNIMTNEQKNDFHNLFVQEFLNNKVKLVETRIKCKLSLEEKNSKLKNSFPLVIKDYPNCVIEEDACLMYEEAYFLAYALGCLRVTNENGTQLNLLDLWRHFSKLDSMFVYKYAVYHHLRTKGWIIKNGIKYGSDFLAYYLGPEYYHASYSIIVKNGHVTHLHESFTKFSGLLRVNENASKDVLICYVLFDGENKDLSSPQCIKNCKIVEILSTRWVPSENRNEKSQKLDESKEKQISFDGFLSFNDDLNKT